MRSTGLVSPGKTSNKKALISLEKREREILEAFVWLKSTKLDREENKDKRKKKEEENKDQEIKTER